MSDLIDRQVAIESVADEIWHYPNECYKNLNVFENAKDLAEHALRGLPSAQPAQQWIPCSEMLPEKCELVLVTVWNDVTIAWRNIYGGWESAEDMYEKGDVIVWMPLPNPYREDGEA